MLLWPLCAVGAENQAVQSGSVEQSPAHKTAEEIAAGEEVVPYSPQAFIAEELKDVGIVEHIGSSLEGDIVFTNRRGEVVDFMDIVHEEKPILLSFFYATCPSMCQYILQAKSETIRKLGLVAGEDFLPVSVSFDSDDDDVLIDETYYDYIARLDVDGPSSEGTGGHKMDHTGENGDGHGHKMDHGAEADNALAETAGREDHGVSLADGLDEYLKNERWLFLHGDDNNILKLTTQLGFLFKRTPRGEEEFAHSAAIYVITPKGKISRYFYGVFFPPFDVKMSLLEAKDEKTRSTLDRVLLYCYRYDPDAGEYVLYAQNLMKTGGLIFIVLLGGLFGFMFRIEKKRKQLHASQAQAKEMIDGGSV